MFSPCRINRQFVCRFCVAGFVSNDLSKSEALQHMLSFHREMLTFRSTSRLDSHPLSAVRDFLFSKFALSSISRVRILPPQRKYARCLGDMVLAVRPKELGSLGRPKPRWEDDIQVDLHEIEWAALTGLMWFRMGTGGGHLYMR
jgi:hypothetical protein